MSNQQKSESSSTKAAQAGYAAATIINGALTGGLKGAAIATAKAFAPKIIAFIIAVISVCILIPFFIFLSVVGAGFQFPSVADTQVIELNNQAIYVGGLYSQFSAFTREEADNIIEYLSAGCDQVVVTESFGNTNDYWLAAISSIYHNQDLYIITEESVKAIIKANIDYSYYIETYTETEEDENGETTSSYTYTIIYIDIWDVGVDALMEKLELDDFKKQWSEFLYQNSVDMQMADIFNPNYDGDMPGVSYGDLTFRDGSSNVVYYNQMDRRWANSPYGKNQTIGYAGCGPTAMAMVVSSLTGSAVTPKEIADWSVENGHCCDGNGSYHSLIPATARAFGLSVEGVGKSQPQRIIDALADSKLVVAIMAPGHFTTTGHFIVLRGITADGKFLVADPISYSKSQKEWEANIIFSEARSNATAGGPFWILY